MPKRHALLIGNSNYDNDFEHLEKPRRNVIDLAEVLRNPNIGGGDNHVEVLTDPSHKKARSEIERFFSGRERDDLMLLYFAGHGFRDEKDHLYLAVKNTKTDRPDSTGISATWITQVIAKSRAKQQVLILDCCHSGAFEVSNDEVPSSSIVVLTSSSVAELAWEEGPFPHSVFSHFLIEGLRTGEADDNRDGWITVVELFGYIKSHLELYNQTPLLRYPFGQKSGAILLARNPNPPSYWDLAVLEYVNDRLRDLSNLSRQYVPLPITDDPVRLLEGHQDLYGMEDEEYARYMTTRCPVQSAMSGANELVVLGSGGAGKTTALQFYAWSCFVDFLATEWSGRLPILLNLASYQGEKDLAAVIALQTDIPVRAVRQYIQDGAITLLADGFNEIPEKALDWVSRELREFAWEERATPNRLIVTSRPTIAKWESLGLPNVTIMSLEPGSIRELIDLTAPSPAAAEFLKKYVALQDRIAWEDQTSVLRMTGLPLVVKMLADLAQREVERGSTIGVDIFPQTRGDLFYRWTNYQIGMWNDRYPLHPEADAQTKLEGLTRLATHMLKQGFGTVLPRSEVLAIWQGLMPEVALDELIDAAVLKEYGAARVAWWHQGIRDSCAASHLYQIMREGELPRDCLKDRDWDDPFVYLAGRLSEQEANDLIEQLMVDDPDDPGYQDHPFLAARCYAEVRQVKDLSAIRPNLFDAMATAHRRTQEITGDIKELEALAREGVDEKTSFSRCMVLGRILEMQGRHDEAEAEFTKALSFLAPSFDDEIDALCHVGNAKRRQGKHEDAVPYFCNALERARESDNHCRDDLPYYELGYVFEKEGLTQEAIRCYDLSYECGEREARRRLETTGDKKAYRRKLGYANMAQGAKSGLLTQCHRFNEAMSIGKSALKAFEEAEQQRWIWNMQANFARLYAERYLHERRESDIEQAKEWFRKSEDKKKVYGYNAGSRRQDYLDQALLFLAQNMYDRAIHCAKLACAALDEATEKDQGAEILHTLGLAHARKGEIEKAINAYRAAIDTDPSLMNRWGIARALRDLAALQFQQSRDIRDAVQNIETAKQLFQALDSLEAKTCQPIIDRALRSQITEEEYYEYVERLPRLEALLPKKLIDVPF